MSTDSLRTIDLGDYRARKSAARAFHPAAWEPIAWPADALATAEAFHAEIANAERGVAVTCPKAASKSRWWLSRGRERRARVMDGLAVALLMALMAAFGVIVWAASAKAEPEPDPVYAWAAVYAGPVCSVLREFRDTPDAAITGVSQGIHEQVPAWSDFQVGKAIAYSVREACPDLQPMLDRFIAKHRGDGAVGS